MYESDIGFGDVIVRAKGSASKVRHTCMDAGPRSYEESENPIIGLEVMVYSMTCYERRGKR